MVWQATCQEASLQATTETVRNERTNMLCLQTSTMCLQTFTGWPDVWNAKIVVLSTWHTLNGFFLDCSAISSFFFSSFSFFHFSNISRRASVNQTIPACSIHRSIQKKNKWIIILTLMCGLTKCKPHNHTAWRPHSSTLHLRQKRQFAAAIAL